MDLPPFIANSNLLYLVITNTEGEVNDANDCFQSTYKHISDNFIGQNLSGIFTLTCRDEFNNAIAACIKQGMPQTIVLHTIYDAGGAVMPVKWEFSPTNDKSTKTKKISCIGCRYDAQNTAEPINAQLNRNEQTYQTLFEDAFDAIMVTDEQWNFVDANSYMCYLFGYTREELLHMNLVSLMDPEQLKTDPIKKIPEGGKLHRERRMVHKNGSIIEVEINVKKSQHDQTMAIARDITARRRADEQIKKEKELSDSIINSLPGIFYLQDEQGKYLRWNQDLAIITGYTNEEIPLLDPFVFFDSNDHEEIVKAMNKALSDGYSELEAEIITKNSERIPHYFVLRSINYEGKLCLISSGIDISEEVKAQIQIQVSESTFRGAFEYSSFGMALVSVEGKWLKVNNELCKLLGYTEEELLTFNVIELTHADDRENTLAIMSQFFDNEIESARFEKRYLHKKGKTIWVNLSVSLIRDSAGVPLYFVSQLEDISGRKEYEDKINDQINLLSEISFITSHELRHEYAKLHAVINFLKDRQDLFVNKEDEFLIKESIKAFNNINASIYKINDKITFGQFMEINLSNDQEMDHEYILLIDDDPIANYINSKLMEKHFDKNKIFKANSADQGIQHLVKENKDGQYIVLLDLNMPKKNGWEFLEEYKAHNFTSPIIILTSSINLSDREKAKKYEVVKKFMSKPLTDESAMQIKKLK